MEASVIVGLLLIAAVWSVYLLPSVFGDRQNTPKNSTEEFDRWTHLMADVQKRPYNRRAVGQRDIIRLRRRRAIGVLAALALVTAALALWQNSLPLLLVHLFVDSLIALYVAALAQMKQQRQWRLKVTHVSERPAEWDEPQVKIVAH
ncbi:MAG TPA: hypothetical protein VLA91_03900 [Acidimicrobiia bacterium]|jgi:hypothetical protein|nr:hypothetical protein [Acidimicrobiia bacterium]